MSVVSPTSMNTSHELDVDRVVVAIHQQFNAVEVTPAVHQYTVLASFVLWNHLTDALKVISLATGLKCLPTARMPPAGDALHDSHAEILARRGAIRWLLEEVGRCVQVGRGSDWIQGQWSSDSESSLTTPPRFALGDGVRILMYISTVPCEFAKFPRILRRHLTSLVQAATLPPVISPHFKMRPWPHSRTLRNQGWPSRPDPLGRPPEGGTTIPSIPSYAPNREGPIHHRLPACPAATRSRLGTCSDFRGHSCPPYSHRSTSRRSSSVTSCRKP